LKIEIGDLKRMHALYHPREHERRLGGLPWHGPTMILARGERLRS
jgi:hypothetical protein